MSVLYVAAVCLLLLHLSAGSSSSSHTGESTSTPKIKLTYFNGRGRAEQIRWILAQGGVKYEDVRIELDDWPKLKPLSPTGGLPFITIGSTRLGQSAAIAVYLGNKYGMLGTTSWEAANIHMLFQSSQEIYNAHSKISLSQGEEKESLMKDYLETKLPPFLLLLKARLVRGDEWLVGKKVSIADISAASILSDVPKEALDLIKACPEVDGLIRRVSALPNIKQWISSRPKTPF